VGVGVVYVLRKVYWLVRQIRNRLETVMDRTGVGIFVAEARSHEQRVLRERTLSAFLTPGGFTSPREE
jgi:hypothetical protein